MLEDLHITNKYPELKIVPNSLAEFLFPLFYLYVQQVSIFSKKKLSYWVLVPGAIVFSIQTVVSFQSLEVKEVISETLWYNLMDMSNIIFSMVIGFITVFYIDKHRKRVQDQYTSLELKDLKWMKAFVIFTLIISFIGIVRNFIQENYYLYLLFSIMNVVIIYLISIRGLLQHNIKNLWLENKESTFDTAVHANKIVEVIKQREEHDLALLKRIESFMLSEKLYLKPDLTIMEVSEKMGIHPKRISKIINSQGKQNFNAYINYFRIEEAKVFLRSDKGNNLSVEGIGINVGFLSKSTFYEAFKKHTGTTPFRYKNEIDVSLVDS
ncbi:MAG: helix-turn-helix transcriptional regulator [Cellulophaga sp.]